MSQMSDEDVINNWQLYSQALEKNPLSGGSRILQILSLLNFDNQYKTRYNRNNFQTILVKSWK